MLLDNLKTILIVLLLIALFAILSAIFLKSESSTFEKLKATCLNWVFHKKFSKIFNTTLLYFAYVTFCIVCSFSRFNNCKYFACIFIGVELGKLCEVLFSIGIRGVLYFIFVVFVERVLLCIFVALSIAQRQNYCQFICIKEAFGSQISLSKCFWLIVVWNFLAIFIILNLLYALF